LRLCVLSLAYRSFAASVFIASAAAFASPAPRPTGDLALINPAGADASRPVVHGTVADPTGAIVPNADIQLVDAKGAVTATFKSDAAGNFQLPSVPPGTYTLIVSEAGFNTVKTTLILGKQLKVPTPTLHIALPIASADTTVSVNAEQDEDLTASENNADTSVMNAADLKALPIFDNDYATAMSAFMDTGSEGTGGAGLIVDGVEANRSSVSASAVREVRINQDPYSAQYYYPGRGQMEIITKSATEQYHGEFNFIFRDSALNAKNALAATKPYEQRRIYEGNVTGPIPHAKNSGFLISFNRAEEDQDAVVLATIGETTSGLPTYLQANVPAPTRETDFSARASHQFGDKHSAYVQYSFYNWNAQGQGVGGQTEGSAAYLNHGHEDDLVAHVDSTLSANLLNQASLVLEHSESSDIDTAETPQIVVSGDFVAGSAQNDNASTEYNGRLYDMATWNRGHHTVKIGIGIPHMSRRAFDDNTNELGTYTFAPTTNPDGTVAASALDNYAANRPSNFTQNGGVSHFIYHQQELGAFIQDQWKISDTFSITPGLRYDWQNFLATKRLAFSPRFSFAWVLDKQSKTVLRGGGGLYYDRFGGGPILDLARYEDGLRRSVNLSLNPATQSCYPITGPDVDPSCPSVTDAPPNLVRNAATHIPYQLQYGLSVERAFGKNATGTVSAYSTRGDDRYRSIDINAPTPQSNYTERPDPNYGRIRVMSPEGTFLGNAFDVSFRGTVNKYFTGFGRYTWSHYESNQEGISWFPQNQNDPDAEWANTGWDRRNRLGMYAMFNRESVINLGVGIFANSGSPWTILTGTDPYGDGLFNARPDGVARNTENLPNYYDLDLRWGHDWRLTDSKPKDSDEQVPKLGFSAGAYNVLNHENPTGVDQVETSSTFGQPTVASPARRVQIAMRFEF
jgi:hypothetical protein